MLEDTYIRISGKCQLEIMCGAYGTNNPANMISMSEHPKNFIFEFGVENKNAPFERPLETFKAIIDRCHKAVAHMSALVDSKGLSAIREHALEKNKPWVDIMTLLAREHEALRTKEGLRNLQSILIRSKARSIHERASIKIADKQMPDSIDTELLEKWIAPLKPAMLIKGDAHNNVELVSYNPWISTTSNILKQELSALEILKIYNSLPEITDPIITKTT